jgi:hypothetical protein
LVVGFNAGGHASFEGEVVYEDGKIDYYSIDYESPVDRTADATNHVVILGSGQPPLHGQHRRGGLGGPT